MNEPQFAPEQIAVARSSAPNRTSAIVTTTSGVEVAAARNSVPTNVCSHPHAGCERLADIRQPRARRDHHERGHRVGPDGLRYGDVGVSLRHLCDEGHPLPPLIVEHGPHRHHICPIMTGVDIPMWPITTITPWPASSDAYRQFRGGQCQRRQHVPLAGAGVEGFVAVQPIDDEIGDIEYTSAQHIAECDIWSVGKRDCAHASDQLRQGGDSREQHQPRPVSALAHLIGNHIARARQVHPRRPNHRNTHDKLRPHHEHRAKPIRAASRTAPPLSSDHQQRAVATVVFLLKLPGCFVPQGWEEIMLVVLAHPRSKRTGQREETGQFLQPHALFFEGTDRSSGRAEKCTCPLSASPMPRAALLPQPDPLGCKTDEQAHSGRCISSQPLGLNDLHEGITLIHRHLRLRPRWGKRSAISLTWQDRLIVQPMSPLLF